MTEHDKAFIRRLWRRGLTVPQIIDRLLERMDPVFTGREDVLAVVAEAKLKPGSGHEPAAR
jgi:hypothetical protein